jgi:uncharacterized protein
MTKFLLLLVVLAVAGWLLIGRRRAPKSEPKPKPKAESEQGHTRTAPEPMLVCAHCGVHLPQADTLADAAGRPYCSEAHRLAGPR